MDEGPYLDAIERLMKESVGRDEIRAATTTLKPPRTLQKLSSNSVARPFKGKRTYLAGLGWPAVIVACLIPAVLIYINFNNLYMTISFSTVTLAIGDYCGIAALVLFVIAIVMTTRWRVIETMFRGLNHVLKAHSLVGAAAVSMILIHTILVTFSNLPFGLHAVAVFLTPQLNQPGILFGMLATVLVIGLIVATIYMKLGYRIWLRSHKFLGLAFLLIAIHVLFVPNKLTVNPYLHTYIWILINLGFGAYLYRSLLPNVFVRRYLYTIKSAVPKEIGTVEVTLTPLDRIIRFQPGQFIFIAFDTDGLSTEWHPFSISSAAFSKDLKIDIKSLGGFTETLTRLLPHMEGMTVHVEGAYGRFSYQNIRNPNQVWIAGGIGITPFLSMIQTLGSEDYNIDLYWSVRHQSELIDIETFSALQSSRPGQVLRVIPFIGDIYNTYLSADIIAKNTENALERDFLMCGPPIMMHGITNQLIKMGVPKKNIHSEEFALK
jgi:predicted ferric reductase